ncbi:MAG: YceI family protein, partial [Pseudomonadota bacterium]
LHQAAAEPQPFTLDLGHAFIGWEIDHFGYSNTVGQFRTFDGNFEIDENNPENSRISFTIDSASIDSNHTGRDNHLRGADFLDVEAYPSIRFVSTRIEMTDAESGLVTGDLTFKGVTKPFSLMFRVTGDASFAEFLPRYDQRRAVGFEAQGRFDRVAHGFDALNFPGSPIGQYIDLKVHFDLVDCQGAPENNIPCQYGRNAELEFPYE